MSKPKIGFIGLGLMGSAMVGRLLDKGYDVTVIANRSRTNVDAAVARGAKEVTSTRDVAQQSDIVMLCVDTSASVEARMRGADGVIAGLKPDAIVIDFGTSLPNSTAALAAEVAEAGGAYLDAPLGRTPAHAVDGLLNIMGAGDKSAFDRAKPVLDDLGENVFHVGPSGAGHTLKLINNFVSQTFACAMSEGFVMADQAGLPRQALYDVMAAGPNHNGMMDFVKAFAIDGDPSKLAFAISNADKDVGYYTEMAQAFGTPSKMAQSAKSALDSAKSAGYGDKMVSEMVSYFENHLKDG
jgi:2-hydroxy-3-oxopropionate reductase